MVRIREREVKKAMQEYTLIKLTMEEVRKIGILYRKYVSTRRPVNLLELYGSVRHEARLAEKGKIKVTRELLRELRSDRAFVGHCARKSIGREELKNPFTPHADYVEWMLSL
jgi:hypothetical protein